MRKIPVFYHIPKNAGTYIGGFALGTLRYFRFYYTDWLASKREGETLKVLQVKNGDHMIARLFISDPLFFTKQYLHVLVKHSEIEFDIDIKDLNDDLLNNIFLYFVSIEANGFRLQNKILDKISKYEHVKFLILREPFSRAQSLYNYIQSNLSKHEYSHGAIKSLTFEDYILSTDLEDSWTIRNLLNIPNEVAIESKHFEQIISLLKDFHVYNMNNVDTALANIFKECYQINVSEIEDRFLKDIHKNDNKYEKFKFEELWPNAQLVFRRRTFWDAKLYEQF